MNALSISIMVAPRLHSSPQAPAVPADALPRTWVDAMPSRAQPYLRLMRLDRPIGTWLLFLPCVFGAALGAATTGRAFGTLRDLGLVCLFAIGATVMRGAGCTYNDIIDREIDARVARTRGRPIPSGAVSVRAALILLLAQCAVGLLVLLQLNLLTILVGIASLALVALYPFMKRITWWPQAWLGLTFNWGVLVGYAAIANRLGFADFLLYAGCFFWTLGYDTIYALQDKDDDALIGVKSTARLFGGQSRQWIAAFFALTILLMGAAIADTWGVRLGLLLIPAAAHFVWQVWTLDIASPPNCLNIFRANREAGLLVAAAFLAASWLAA
jgi:4-hydroxybenzoate polyprenyltransferase